MTLAAVTSLCASIQREQAMTFWDDDCPDLFDLINRAAYIQNNNKKVKVAQP